MIGVKSHLDMIATEAIEEDAIGRLEDLPHESTPVTNNLPAIRYNLEIIKNPDGTYSWFE